MTEKVRHGHVEITMDRPGDTLPLEWGFAAHKSLAGAVTFYDGPGGLPQETVSWEIGYCVHYGEDFDDGTRDGTRPSYLCHLRIASPQLAMKAGGPPAAMRPAPARDHGSPPVAVVVVPAAPNAKGIPLKLAAGTPEHKQDRWARYQAKKAGNPKAWNYARWERQYDTNMRNVSFGLGREREYCQAWSGQSKTLKTAFTLRQIDIYRADDDYCGQLKTGKVSLTAQAEIDLIKDADLINNQYQVEYILEKSASQNFLKALDRIGATYKLGPQIP